MSKFFRLFKKVPEGFDATQFLSEDAMKWTKWADEEFAICT